MVFFECYAIDNCGKRYDFGYIESSTERKAKMFVSRAFSGNYTLYLENSSVIFAKSFFYGTWSKFYK